MTIYVPVPGVEPGTSVILDGDQDIIDTPDVMVGVVCTPTTVEIDAWAPRELDLAVVVQWPGGRERRWEYCEDLFVRTTVDRR